MVGSVNGFVACSTGVNVRATVNMADPTARIGAQSVRFQPAAANAGLVYVGTFGMNITTGVGVLGVLGDPASATQGPYPVLEFVQRDGSAGLNVADFYVQGPTSDAVIVSYIQG